MRMLGGGQERGAVGTEQGKSDFGMNQRDFVTRFHTVQHQRLLLKAVLTKWGEMERNSLTACTCSSYTGRCSMGKRQSPFLPWAVTAVRSTCCCGMFSSSVSYLASLATKLANLLSLQL